MARIFISHSADPGGHTAKIKQLIAARLEQTGHVPFTDVRIGVGEEWRARLYRELAACDAAIVLLDRRALDRDAYWLHSEVNCLLWRRYLGRVRIVTVLLDGVSRKELGFNGFGDLAGFQLLPFGRTTDPHPVAERVANEFTASPAVATSDGMRSWLDSALRPILFLGYAADDIWFRALWHSIWKMLPREERRRHIGVYLVSSLKDDEPRTRARAMSYLNDRADKDSISVYWGTAEDFTAELAARIS